MDVEMYQVPVVVVNEESAVDGGEETIEPGKILAELGGEGEGSLFWALPECI